MGKLIQGKNTVLAIAKEYYNRDADREWLKQVHGMSHTTLWRRMQDYGIKTKVVVVE